MRKKLRWFVANAYLVTIRPLNLHMVLANASKSLNFVRNVIITHYIKKVNKERYNMEALKDFFQKLTLFC